MTIETRDFQVIFFMSLNLENIPRRLGKVVTIPGHTPKPNLYKNVFVSLWWSMVEIHLHFLSRCGTITFALYSSDIDIMLQKIVKEQPALVNPKVHILLQDNARPHVSRET